MSGDLSTAFHLAAALLPDLERVLGTWHPYTLAARNNLAAWKGLAGNPAGACSLFQDLLPDTKRSMGPRHPRTAAVRRNAAAFAHAAGHCSCSRRRP